LDAGELDNLVLVCEPNDIGVGVRIVLEYDGIAVFAGGPLYPGSLLILGLVGILDGHNEHGPENIGVFVVAPEAAHFGLVGVYLILQHEEAGLWALVSLLDEEHRRVALDPPIVKMERRRSGVRARMKVVWMIAPERTAGLGEGAGHQQQKEQR
jgi:hypothetical protein